MTNTPTPPPVNVDPAAGLAYVHRDNPTGQHTLDTEDLSRCDYCTPIVDKISGGNDGSESPLASADPDFAGEGVGAACPFNTCPAVLLGRDIDEAKEALAIHVDQWHYLDDPKDAA